MSAFQLATTCITCHAWSPDRQKIAFCPNNNEVHIYKKQGAEWVPDSVLTEHDQTVTGIDWAAKSNRIVTCSQDRNAYVWTFEGGKWKPTLVILRINRAATHVKWSPCEQKFAVASGARCVSVCYFEEDNDWWVSKHIKKHKSTVLSIAWHPTNSTLIATGSSDFKARVFSAYVRDVDTNPQDSPFGRALPFGQPLAEYNANGWVHAVDWTPSGNTLGYVAHDSTINFVDISSGQVSKISTPNLPFRTILFLSETAVVASGHDCNISLFQNQGGRWNYVKDLDEAAGGAAKKAASSTAAARNMFQSKVDYGTTSNATVLNTKHQNAINCVQPTKSASGKITEIATTAVDGQLILWNTASF
ncbi:Actin-related protein 2/3 complex subunit [Balamuthia mandrillaris]